MALKTIANLIPTMSAVALASDNINTVKKGTPLRDGSGKGKRLNKGRGGCEFPRVVGQGMRNIVGISLIKTQSDLISEL
jgi:hypothetical protein